MSPKKEIDRFPVKTRGGKEYTIIQYQDYKIIHTGGNAPPTEIAGSMSFLTTGGLRVNQTDTKTFKIVPTDETVWKI
jgi:hypothetical protein